MVRVLSKLDVNDFGAAVDFILEFYTKHQPTAITTVSVGTLDSSLVHPREVFKVAILSNAAAMILAHNHPSGVATHSEDDITITKRLIDAGTVMGIDVLDHIIIGGSDNYKSMRELGAI